MWSRCGHIVDAYATRGEADHAFEWRDGAPSVGARSLDQQHPRRARELTLRRRQPGRHLPGAAIDPDLDLMEPRSDGQGRLPAVTARRGERDGRPLGEIARDLDLRRVAAPDANRGAT